MKEGMFMAWIYINSSMNLERYVLGDVTGNNPFIVFGINPSYATPSKLDPTLRQVESMSKILGYTGWIMLNIYPQRSTNPNGMHATINNSIHNDNLIEIEKIIKQYPNVRLHAMWGNNITLRSYLKTTCLTDIENLRKTHSTSDWYYLGGKTQLGEPWHPLYVYRQQNSANKKGLVVNYYQEHIL
jgi:hypothetical protein